MKNIMRKKNVFDVGRGVVRYGWFHVFDVGRGWVWVILCIWCAMWGGGWELDDSIYFQFYFQHSTIYAESNNMSICCHYIATLCRHKSIVIEL
jgi:hypothetical protein